MMHELMRLDYEFFRLINVTGSHEILDFLAPILSGLHGLWWAVWIVLPILLIRLSKRYRGFFPAGIVHAFIVVVSVDAICHRIIKPAVARPRPDAAELHIVPRARSAGLYSWPSNHAANSFAAATAISLFTGVFQTEIFVLAAAVAYSRVYLGVHYPSDVLGGALLGILFAWAIHYLWIAVWTSLRRRA